MNWIKGEIELQGKLVKLVPLSRDHFTELQLVSADERIWTYLKHDGLSPQLLKEYLEEALAKKEKGLQYPFTVFHLATNRIIGTTRFWKINAAHKKLELGWTWLSPEYWGGGYNLEAKYLLLHYCFETLGAIKVSLVASEDNLPSRKAIEKLGARLEGVLRKERICADNVARGFAVYSIIDEEWPEVKGRLIINLQS
jgi:RimJ/RimL family protein N-acetyltransferase